MHPILLYAPIHSYVSIHLYTPYPLYICMFSLYHMFPICHRTQGAFVDPIHLRVFWGASVHLSGILMSVSTSICPSIHNSHTSCSPSLWVASLLDWMPMDVCYASCCCSFLCSYHYVSSFYSLSYDYYCSHDLCVPLHCLFSQQLT